MFPVGKLDHLVITLLAYYYIGILYLSIRIIEYIYTQSIAGSFRTFGSIELIYKEKWAHTHTRKKYSGPALPFPSLALDMENRKREEYKRRTWEGPDFHPSSSSSSSARDSNQPEESRHTHKSPDIISSAYLNGRLIDSGSFFLFFSPFPSLLSIWYSPFSSPFYYR